MKPLRVSTPELIFAINPLIRGKKIEQHFVFLWRKNKEDKDRSILIQIVYICYIAYPIQLLF